MIKSIAIFIWLWYNMVVMEIREIEQIYKTEILGEKREKIEEFRLLLTEYNQKYNLTAITEKEEVYYKRLRNGFV